MSRSLAARSFSTCPRWIRPWKPILRWDCCFTPPEAYTAHRLVGDAGRGRRRKCGRPQFWGGLRLPSWVLIQAHVYEQTSGNRWLEEFWLLPEDVPFEFAAAQALHGELRGCCASGLWNV